MRAQLAKSQGVSISQAQSSGAKGSLGPPMPQSPRWAHDGKGRMIESEETRAVLQGIRARLEDAANKGRDTAVQTVMDNRLFHEKPPEIENIEKFPSLVHDKALRIILTRFGGKDSEVDGTFGEALFRWKDAGGCTSEKLLQEYRKVAREMREISKALWVTRWSRGWNEHRISYNDHDEIIRFREQQAERIEVVRQSTDLEQFLWDYQDWIASDSPDLNNLKREEVEMMDNAIETIFDVFEDTGARTEEEDRQYAMNQAKERSFPDRDYFLHAFTPWKENEEHSVELIHGIFEWLYFNGGEHERLLSYWEGQLEDGEPPTQEEVVEYLNQHCQQWSDHAHWLKHRTNSKDVDPIMHGPGKLYEFADRMLVFLKKIGVCGGKGKDWPYKQMQALEKFIWTGKRFPGKDLEM
jgi:hypothetical protein